jgi:5-methylcytosine-specific restriction enzyme subunit McrC
MTNTLPNQIIKATARFLARVPDLDRALRDRLLRLGRRLPEIDEVRITTLSFRQVQLHSNNRYYRFLLNVCELVHGSWLVDEQSGDYRFRDFLRDEQRMARVFQDFVLNFYRAERPDLGARAEQIAWKAQSRQDGALTYLPRMVTDISLKRGNAKLIIDTKYYSSTLSRYYDAETIHSGNLYQLLAYLSNVELQPGESVEGMLLYPVVKDELRLRYDELQGFPVRICTVNLAREWREIRAELLSLVE